MQPYLPGPNSVIVMDNCRIPCQIHQLRCFYYIVKTDWGEVDTPGMALHHLLTSKKLRKMPINQYVAQVDRDISMANIKEDMTKAHMLLLGLPPDLKEKLRDWEVPLKVTKT